MPVLPALQALHLAYAPSLASSCWWSALTQLTALSLRNCGLVAMPEDVTRLPNLEVRHVFSPQVPTAVCRLLCIPCISGYIIYSAQLAIVMTLCSFCNVTLGN